jgi:hypothetical protein
MAQVLSQASTHTTHTNNAPGNLSNRNSSQTRGESENSRRQLKQEMAQTMKVIEKINKEFEQMTKQSQ